MDALQHIKALEFLEGVESKRHPSIAGAPVPVNRHGLSVIAVRIIDNIIAKNHDYGDAWQALGMVGAGARFVDKMFRIERLADGLEALVVDEKFTDTVEDLIGYGLLILLYEMYKGKGRTS